MFQLEVGVEVEDELGKTRTGINGTALLYLGVMAFIRIYNSPAKGSETM